MDDRTLPPSILEYSNHPHDIYLYIDPWNRVTRYDRTSPVEWPAFYTKQHIHMTLNIEAGGGRTSWHSLVSAAPRCNVRQKVREMDGRANA